MDVNALLGHISVPVRSLGYTLGQRKVRAQHFHDADVRLYKPAYLVQILLRVR